MRLPKSVTGRGGVILGNYGGLTACVNVEINSNGNPRFYYVDTDKTVHNYVFSGVDVRGEDWAHLAFVHDSESQYLHCYLNGERKATARGATPLQEKAFAMTLSLGGDLRGDNAQYFKGAIRSVTVYADMRTEDEILADMQAVDTKEEHLPAPSF